MTDAPWEKPPEATSEQIEVVKKMIVEEVQNPTEATSKQVEAGEELIIKEVQDPEEQHFDTGITFRGIRILLDADDQETVDAFKKAYHKLERHYLGDYGN